MKKCKFCTADMRENETKCSYCGKEQDDEKKESSNIVKEKSKVEFSNKEKTKYNHIKKSVKKNNILFISLIITIALSMIACFLPYIKIGDFSFNYVYNENLASLSSSNGIKNGIFIIVLGIASILTMLIGKKKIPVVVCQFLSIGVFLIDYLDAKENAITNLITRYYGIGFYLVIVFLVISEILAVIRLICKDKFE